jgi:hypothetical protein
VLKVIVNQEDIYAAHMANGQFEVRLTCSLWEYVEAKSYRYLVTIFVEDEGLDIPPSPPLHLPPLPTSPPPPAMVMIASF